MQFIHVPVMLGECMDALDLQDGGIYFDGTLGGAGHSYEILARTSPSGRLIATDLDREAIRAASDKLRNYEGRFTLVNDNFKNASEIFDRLGVDKIDGALLDLGVSSYQLDERERGFSYIADARLDMRMNREQKLSAYEVVNGYDEKRLKEILFLYGEERFSSRIAENIAERRKIRAIETTGELADIIDKSIPAKFKRDGHPAKRTFQAIRIEVNGELEGLDKAVHDIADRLKKGGRFAVMTFHSLEDRIIKHAFCDLATGCTCDRNIPVCICGRKEKAKILTKKPIVASVAETERNSRAKSAKLRVIEKIV